MRAAAYLCRSSARPNPWSAEVRGCTKGEKTVRDEKESKSKRMVTVHEAGWTSSPMKRRAAWEEPHSSCA